VNINRRGEIWINLRDKPQPVFRVVQAKRVENTDEPAAAENTGGGAPAEGSAQAAPAEEPTHFVPREQRQQNQQNPRNQPQEQRAPAGPKTFLDKIRGMMRRNRRGHGMSGSFPYLIKALKTDEAGLLAQLAEHGVVIAESGQPAEVQSGDFIYWLNKNQRGEIWINAELKRRGKEQGDRSKEQGTESKESASAENSTPVVAESSAPVAAPVVEPVAPAAEQAPEVVPPPPDHTLAAVRLLMEPKKRGEGVTALVSELAEKLAKTPEVLTAALAAAGLQLPETPKGKPTFAEHGGEVFWLNANAKGQVWLNAKPAAATKKSRAKKTEE
jgi:hypothetical protein